MSESNFPTAVAEETSQTLNVIIKSVKGPVNTISVHASDSIESKLDEIRQLFGIDVSATIKLVFSGRVLTDLTKTFAEQQIINDSTVVLMPVPKKSTVPVAAPVPAPVPALVPVSAPPAMASASSEIASASTTSTNPIIEFWKNTPVSDSTLSFSIDQLHATMSVFIPIILKEPTIFMQLITNTHGFGQLLSTPQMRNLLKDLLGQSAGIVHSLRSGTPIEISIRGSPPSNPVPVPVEPLDEEDTKEDEMSIAFGTAINNAISIFANPSLHQERQEHQEHQENSTTTDSENSDLSSDDANIDQIVEITNVSREIAAKMYFDCGKNVNTAVSVIMESFERR